MNKFFRTWFIGFSYIIVGLEAFSAGVDSVHHWWAQVVFDLVICAFWVGMGLLFAHMAYKDGKLDADMDNLKRTSKLFDELANLEQDRMKAAMAAKPINHQKELSDTLMGIINDVTGGNRPPKPQELATIAGKFHEATQDHWVKITLQSGGMNVEIKNQPFEKAKARKPRASRAKKLEQTELVPQSQTRPVKAIKPE